MLQLPSDLRFGTKAFCCRPGRPILAQEFDGNFSAETQVSGAMDNAHAAPADFGEEFITRQDRRSLIRGKRAT
jgi:hypothetical protein